MIQELILSFLFRDGYSAAKYYEQFFGHHFYDSYRNLKKIFFIYSNFFLFSQYDYTFDWTLLKQKATMNNPSTTTTNQTEAAGTSAQPQ